MKTTYSTARATLKVLAILGLLSLLAGALLVLVAIGDVQDPALAGTGIAVAILGVLQIAAAQIATAILDQADTSRAQLEVLKGMASSQNVEPLETRSA